MYLPASHARMEQVLERIRSDLIESGTRPYYMCIREDPKRHQIILRYLTTSAEDKTVSLPTTEGGHDNDVHTLQDVVLPSFMEGFWHSRNFSKENTRGFFSIQWPYFDHSRRPKDWD